MARPAALVLGWGSSTARQLRPFVAAWDELGLTATAFVPATLRSLVDPDHLLQQADQLARSRWDVVHALSDNGFVTWSLLQRALRRRGAALPSAVALDSCPGVRRWRTRAGFAAAFGRGMTPAALRTLGRPPVEVHPWITPALELAFRGVHRALPRSMALVAASLERALELPPRPHLLVAGPGDAIVPEDEVLAFAEVLRGAGHDVAMLRVVGSGHVAHLRVDPVRYRQALRELLARGGIDVAEPR